MPGLCCCTWAFSSCGEWGLFSSCRAWDFHCSGFSCCGQGTGSSVRAQQLWHMGSAVPQHMRSSQIGDQTCVPALAGGFLIPGIPGKPCDISFFFFFLMWTTFKVFIEFVTILFQFHVLVFGRQACGFLVPRPGIEPAPPALGSKVLTTGPPGMSQH